MRDAQSYPGRLPTRVVSPFRIMAAMSARARHARFWLGLASSLALVATERCCRSSENRRLLGRPRRFDQPGGAVVLVGVAKSTDLASGDAQKLGSLPSFEPPLERAANDPETPPLGAARRPGVRIRRRALGQPHGSHKASFRMCQALTPTGRYKAIDLFHENAEQRRPEVRLPEAPTCHLLEPFMLSPRAI
jgi:hypothetical protein